MVGLEEPEVWVPEPFLREVRVGGGVLAGGVEMEELTVEVGAPEVQLAGARGCAAQANPGLGGGQGWVGSAVVYRRFCARFSFLSEFFWLVLGHTGRESR